MKVTSLVSIVWTILYIESTFSSDSCNSHDSSCSDCIQTPNCFWIFKPFLRSNESRCRSNESNILPEEYIPTYNPGNLLETYRYLSLEDEEVFIAPQQARLTIRIGTPTFIKFKVKNSNFSTLEIGHTAPDFIKTDFFTNCNNSDEKEIESNKCDNIVQTREIEFTVKLEALKCPKNPTDFHQIVKIYPQQINQSFILETHLSCKCPCESPQQVVPKAPPCNHRGTYKCGICECIGNATGPHCECDGPIDWNLVQDKTCSHRGTYVCGQCECDLRANPEERIYGTQCECDNFSCTRHQGLLCGGQGVCECGVCVCKEDWTGEACECRKDIETCR